jgi:hypothetical protein
LALLAQFIFEHAGCAQLRAVRLRPLAFLAVSATVALTAFTELVLHLAGAT